MTVDQKVFKLSATERRMLAVRLTRFVSSVAACSLPLWLVYTLILFAVEGTKEGITALVLSRELVVGGFGILFTLLVSVGIRYLESRGRLVPLRYTLGILWVLVVSTAWWNVTQFVLRFAGLAETVPAYGLLAQGWVSIPFVGALFYVTYAIREYVALKRRRKIESRRRRAFEMYPKALAASDQLDIFEIIASLDVLKRAYKESRRRGDRLLEFLQYELSLSSDPRYNLPMPLPVALEFLRCEFELRRRAQIWSATIKVDAINSFPTEMVVEPAVLCAAGMLAAEYGLYRRQRGIALNIIFQESPMPCVEIQTNLKGGDPRFVLDDQSPAQRAKNRLVETLNRFASKGSIFESTQDSHGYLVFRVSVRTDCAGDAVWENVARTLGHGVQLLTHCDRSEGSNRVYVNDNQIDKVQLIGRHSPKSLMLAEEYNILRRLQDVEGMPQSPKYKEYANFAVLSYAKTDGRPIGEYLAHCGFERSAWFRCIAELSALLHRIHKRGVLHRDLRPDNVLVREDGRVCLIDFDQAVAGAYEAQQVDIQGERYGVIPPCVSVRQLINLLGLRDEYDMVVEELRSAWQIGARSNASSPGRNIAYYRWVFGDVELPGERDWFSRWDIMHKALRQFLPGARVLDLGCNLGLVATHCVLYGAERVTAVDVHDDILEAGHTLARAAGVSIDFLEGDLNSHDFVDSILSREYDLVIALSVVHWLENPDEALRLLAAAPMVLFEGHDPPLVEINRLRELGFGKVQLIGYSERLRGLCLGLR